MSILFDVAFIAVIVIFAVIAAKRSGIFDEVTKTATVLFSSAAAVKFSSFLSVATFEGFFKDAIAKQLLPLTEKIFYLDGQSSNVERVLRALPGFIANGSQWMVFNDKAAVAKLESYVYHPAEIAAQEISSLVAGPVFISVFKGLYLILGFFVFYSIFKIIFSELKFGLDGIAYNDSVFCGCMGAVKGFIYVLLFLGMINLILPIFPFYGQFVTLIDDTTIFNIIYNENIFVL